MGKVIRLSESQLKEVIKRVINEQNPEEKVKKLRLLNLFLKKKNYLTILNKIVDKIWNKSSYLSKGMNIPIEGVPFSQDLNLPGKKITITIHPILTLNKASFNYVTPTNQGSTMSVRFILNCKIKTTVSGLSGNFTKDVIDTGTAAIDDYLGRYLPEEFNVNEAQNYDDFQTVNATLDVQGTYSVTETDNEGKNLNLTPTTFVLNSSSVIVPNTNGAVKVFIQNNIIKVNIGDVMGIPVNKTFNTRNISKFDVVSNFMKTVPIPISIGEIKSLLSPQEIEG